MELPTMYTYQYKLKLVRVLMYITRLLYCVDYVTIAYKPQQKYH